MYINQKLNQIIFQRKINQQKVILKQLILIINFLKVQKQFYKKPKENDTLLMSNEFQKYQDTQQILRQLYKDMCQFLQNQNIDHIDIFEKDFGMTLLSNLNSLNNKKISYHIEDINLDDIDIEPLEILNIFGLSPNRYKNFPFDKIELIKNFYSKGLLVYQIDPSYCYSNFNCSNNYRSMIRLMARVTHKPIFNLQKNNETIKQETKNLNTHLVIFEHSFKTPIQEQMYIIDQGDYESIAQYSIPGEWKISDIDGFFQGNPIYRKGLNYELINNQQWIKKIIQIYNKFFLFYFFHQFIQEQDMDLNLRKHLQIYTFIYQYLYLVE